MNETHNFWKSLILKEIETDKIDCSTTNVAESPFLITAEDAQQTLSTAIEDGVPEPLTDSSKIFFYHHNQYSKSKL